MVALLALIGKSYCCGHLTKMEQQYKHSNGKTCSQEVAPSDDFHPGSQEVAHLPCLLTYQHIQAEDQIQDHTDDIRHMLLNKSRILESKGHKEISSLASSSDDRRGQR